MTAPPLRWSRHLAAATATSTVLANRHAGAPAGVGLIAMSAARGRLAAAPTRPVARPATRPVRRRSP